MTDQTPAAHEAAFDCEVLVFAKAPVPGTVNTRLAPVLGADGAAELHRRLTRQSVATALRAGVGPVTLCCAPDTGHPFFRRLERRLGVSLQPQRGADLGERMADALDRALKRRRAAILIGADCPELDADYLRSAARLLTREALPVVLGPALDGGYVLIGASRMDPSLFQGVPWGEAGVLSATRARLRALGWAFGELAVLADIDRPEDLKGAPLLTVPEAGEVPGRPKGPG